MCSPSSEFHTDTDTSEQYMFGSWSLIENIAYCLCWRNFCLVNFKLVYLLIWFYCYCGLFAHGCCTTAVKCEMLWHWMNTSCMLCLKMIMLMAIVITAEIYKNWVFGLLGNLALPPVFQVWCAGGTATSSRRAGNNDARTVSCLAWQWLARCHNLN